MKVVVLGAGGWGALVGACLSSVGADVTLLFRRQAHVDEIQRNGGLIIRSVAGEKVVPVSATIHPEDIPSTDLLLVAVKNHDTPAALDSVRHMQVGSVASVQNGLGHAERFRLWYPHQPILRMVSRVSGSLLDYGIVHRGDTDAPTWIGDADHGVTSLVKEVVQMFNDSRLNCEASDDIEGVEWCKLIWWTPISISAVLSRLTTTEMMQSPDFAYLLAMVTGDMVNVAHTLGIRVRDYPTIEVLDRVSGTVEERVQSVMRQGKEWEEHGGAGYKQAMLLDVERNRKTEIDDTGGMIWHLARQHNVDVPYLDFGYRVVRAFDERNK